MIIMMLTFAACGLETLHLRSQIELDTTEGEVSPQPEPEEKEPVQETDEYGHPII